jgi:hypothetical protein
MEHERRMFETGSAEIGRPMRAPPDRTADLEAGGMVFAGGPDELAERIELLGTRVLPRIREEIEGR